MSIRQDEVPLISTIAATLLAGRMDGMYDVDLCVTDAVRVAECILHKAQTKVQVNGGQRTVHQARQPFAHSRQHQDADFA